MVIASEVIVFHHEGESLPDLRDYSGIRWLTHNVVNKGIKRGDAVSAFAPTEQFGAMNIKGCDIGSGTTPNVFMLHFHLQARLGRIG